MQDETEIKKRIRDLRKKLKLSQEDVAFKLNITQAGYSAIEGGKSKINIDVLYKIADILQVSPMYLLTGEDGEPDDDDTDNIYEVREQAEVYAKNVRVELSNKDLKLILDMKNEFIRELQVQLSEIRKSIEKSYERMDKKDEIIDKLMEKLANI